MTAGGTAAYLDGGTKKYKKKYKLVFDADGGETEESERELQLLLKDDPLCHRKNRCTKGMMADANSYDDRTFLRIEI